MFRGPKIVGLPTLPRPFPSRRKLLLGVIFFILFFSITIGVPTAVSAQETKPQISFQLPHQGYVSTRFTSYHPGIDVATQLGTPIHPVADGTVIETGFNVWGLGLSVTIEHPDGYKSVYAHMGKINVTKDQKVTPSDTLGEVGLTGNTTGPHTHLEVSKDGNRIDPLSLLPSISNEPKPEFLGSVDKPASSTEQAVKTPVLQPATPTGGYYPPPTATITTQLDFRKQLQLSL
jgi:murein DD-endopeptidase MepM/ murein hydrolase activator NlpD